MSRRSDEWKILRRRQAELAESLDRRNLGPRNGAPSFAGQILDGGHKPTSLPGYFLVHPINSFGGTESEGHDVTFDVNTDRSVPVLVVGTKVPAVGDILPIDLIDGRWVAERYGATPSDISQPSCRCVLVPSLVHFHGSYAHSAGIPGALSPTERGLPTDTTLTAQPTPSWYHIFVPSGTVWLSPSFTYSAFNSSTGLYEDHTAAILFACVFNTHELIAGIVDSTSGQGLDCNLSAFPDSHSISFACSPFLWQYSASCPNWFGTTTLSTGP